MEITEDIYEYKGMYEYLKDNLRRGDELDKFDLLDQLGDYSFSLIEDIHDNTFNIYTGDACITISEREDSVDIVIAVRKFRDYTKVIVNRIVEIIQKKIEEKELKNEEGYIREAIFEEVSDKVTSLNYYAILQENEMYDPEELRSYDMQIISYKVTSLNYYAILQENEMYDPEELRSYNMQIEGFESIQHILLDLAEEIVFAHALGELALIEGINID